MVSWGSEERRGEGLTDGGGGVKSEDLKTDTEGTTTGQVWVGWGVLFIPLDCAAQHTFHRDINVV